MPYNFILIDNITCETIVDVMHYDGNNPNSQKLWELQMISGNKIANGEKGLFLITSHTKEIIDKNYPEDNVPMSLSCLLSACGEIDISAKDEIDSILKVSSWLSWKKINFCILSGNSLLRNKATTIGFENYDISDINELIDKL